MHRLLAVLVEVPEVGVEAEVMMAIEVELTLVLSEPELIALVLVLLEQELVA